MDTKNIREHNHIICVGILRSFQLTKAEGMHAEACHDSLLLHSFNGNIYSNVCN